MQPDYPKLPMLTMCPAGLLLLTLRLATRHDAALSVLPCASCGLPLTEVWCSQGRRP